MEKKIDAQKETTIMTIKRGQLDDGRGNSQS